MKVTFLGTGAAEGIPALYCRCNFCEQARENGGKDIRTRSALRIGDKYQIDLPPETFTQMINNGIDLYDLEHVFITHSHLDHFQFEILFEKVMAKVNNGKPVNIYLSEAAWLFNRKLISHFELRQKDKRIRTLWHWVNINVVKPYDLFKAGELEVRVLIGNHEAWGNNEKALNYLITMPSGSKLLYAVDTGYYDNSNWDYLREFSLKEKSIDALIMECTFGARRDRDKYPESHLDIKSYLLMLEQMKELGVISGNTKVYVTHINPHHGMLHNDLESYFKNISDFDITVAYDGLSIDV